MTRPLAVVAISGTYRYSGARTTAPAGNPDVIDVARQPVDVPHSRLLLGAGRSHAYCSEGRMGRLFILRFRATEAGPKRRSHSSSGWPRHSPFRLLKVSIPADPP